MAMDTPWGNASPPFAAWAEEGMMNRELEGRVPERAAALHFSCDLIDTRLKTA